MVNLVMVDEVARKALGIEDAGSKVYKDRDGEKAVALYIVGDASHDAVRAFVAKALPPYAVPTMIISIDSVPRNANGKLVRKKLPDVMTGPAFKAEPEPKGVPAKVLWVVR